jgi:predicted TIM-barrel fold metal-dependent hydrolase
MEYKVISADNHIIEPRDLFETRMPIEFRDRAPRMVRGKDGGDGWSWRGEVPERTLGIEATAGREIVPAGLKWEDILPGNYEGAAHIADMQKGGVDASILFANVAMSGWSMKDDPFGKALMETFNTWMMEDFCSADPKQLIGLPMLPVNHGVEASIAEAERGLKQGARGFQIPVFPDTPYIDSIYESLWAWAADAGTPLCMHRTSGGNDPSGASMFNYKIPGLNVASSVIRFFAGVDPLTKLIFTGVFQRHPRLKLLDAEINFGWIPFWKNTMDENWERQKGWANFPFEHRPSDVLGKNVFVTVLDDKLGFDMIKTEPYLADTAMFSLDYPHSFCLWPDTTGFIEQCAGNVDTVAKEKVLAGNAVRAFALN